MTSAADYLAFGDLAMGHLEQFVRLRAGLIPDPYDPDSVIAEDWANLDRLTFRAYISSGASTESAADRREQVVSRSVLVVPDPAIDIRRGDRIEDDAGRVWTVQGFPARDQNPFTGWRPTLVVALEEVRG